MPEYVDSLCVATKRGNSYAFVYGGRVGLDAHLQHYFEGCVATILAKDDIDVFNRVVGFWEGKA